MTSKKRNDVKAKAKDKHKIRPDLEEAFQGSVIKQCISDVLVNVLEGKKRDKFSVIKINTNLTLFRT